MRARNEERNRRALEMRKSGMMFKDIAKALGLSQGRTWKIINNQARWDGEKNEE